MSGEVVDDAAAVAPAVSQADLAQRVAREQLRLIQRQVGRLPLASALIDVFICWVVARVGLLGPALLWLSVLLAVQVWRWMEVRRAIARPTADPQVALRSLSTVLMLLGVLRGSLALVLFSRPVQVEHYFFTMVYVGMMAGAVGSVAGLAWPFFVWGALACGTLAAAWMAQGTADAIWQGVLILVLLVMLTGHVRDQRKGLEQFIKLAYDNERLAESLRAARDQAESASLSKTRFFAAASHDLRQPLHALSINATTLEILARRDANPMIRELSQSINRALNQSNSLLDSLLDISNLDADAVKPQLRATDLGALLASVREEFAALAARKGLALTLEVPTTATTTAALAWTDPDLLRRILNNLVGNALKFSHAGGVTLGAARVPESDGVAAWRVFVSDTGPGIAAAEQERVFEEFYQIGNPSRDRSKGLGLGLSIVKRTAALLGAPLQLTSRSGAGTCVELRLMPAETPQGAPADAPEEATDDALDTGMLAGLRVLVVDDEAEILSSLQGLLAQLGCEVRCAPDGNAAVAWLAQGFAPQVLLIDHRLRDESGTDVIARVAAVLGPVPAVIVTGDTEPATIQLAHAAGHRVIHKPVQGAQLIRALREAVERGGPAGA